MKKVFALCLVLAGMLTQAATGYASGADAENAAAPKSTRAKMLVGTPVNVNIAGGGTLPKGKLLTVINASFADKNRAKEGYTGSDVFSQAWLLKLRYGITNHLEMSATTPYINNTRTNPTPKPKHIEGFADQVISLTYAFANMHQGDPYALSVSAGLMLPTGSEGSNHLPGVGAWGGRLQAGYAKFLTKDMRFDTEVAWSGPFERGNKKVKRGDQWQWNNQLRYLFDVVDVGLESNLIHQEAGSMSLPNGGGTRNLRNSYTELFAGPSVNVALDAINAWAGVGAFFPVIQSYKAPTAAEDVRFEFKFAVLW